MSKELEALENIKGLWVEVLNDQDKLVKETVGDLPSAKIIEKALDEHEQLTILMNKYDIKSIKELEHIILNDATGEQAFKDYCQTTGHQHLNCQRIGLIKNNNGYGLVNTDLFPYDKDSNEECKKNLISSNLLEALKALEIIKEKRVDTRAFIEILEDEWTWEQYMDEEDDINTGGHQFSRDRLTKEEYDLLREVLL